MDCKKAEKLLVEYLYQELSPESTLEIEKHLETCDSCAKTLENWRGIHRGFQRSNDLPQPTPFLKTRILAAAREEAERQPRFAERLMVWLKPALVLPVLIFGLLVLLFLPSRPTEMARAKAPAQAERQAPPAPAKAAQPTLDKETAEKLRALGYVSDSKESPKTPTEGYSDELKRKAEADRSESRDQAARGALAADTKKTGSYNEEPPPTAPEEKQPAAEVQPQDMAQQESSKVAESPVMRPAPAQPAPPAAAAPQAASGFTTGGKLDVTAANFQKAQTLFKNNDLPEGTNLAKEAIRTDKDKSLASQFHEAGRQYQSQGEPQQAIVQYNLVLNNYPDYPGSSDVLMRLAESYEQIGEYGKAIRTYQQLARIPSMQKAAEDRMRTLSKKREVQEQLRSLGYVEKN